MLNLINKVSKTYTEEKIIKEDKEVSIAIQSKIIKKPIFETSNSTRLNKNYKLNFDNNVNFLNNKFEKLINIYKYIFSLY